MDEKFENLKYYMHYYIKMLYLNSLIIHVSKHPIVEFEDFCKRNPQLDGSPNYPYTSKLNEYKHKFPNCSFND